MMQLSALMRAYTGRQVMSSFGVYGIVGGGWIGCFRHVETGRSSADVLSHPDLLAFSVYLP